MTPFTPTSPLRILFVDDEPDLYLASAESFRDAGHEVHIAYDGMTALNLIKSRTFDVVFSDVRMPKLDGPTLSRLARECSPTTSVFLVTGFGEVREAVAAIKDGVDNYLSKPLGLDDIARRVEEVAGVLSTRRQMSEAQARLALLDPSEAIIGRSDVMRGMMARLSTFAGSDASVLLRGETGTGKELVARQLHARGARRDSPFVVVNCPAFPDTLLESELFGHVRGAFTGAVGSRTGRFQAAHGGTLLLDEVGDMAPVAQVKVLRALQDHVIEPLGTNDSVAVDVRVISATHRDLGQLMRAGMFREDLYYRLDVLRIDVPPLRAREGDLPLLIQYFLNKFHRAGAGPTRLSPAVWIALSTFGFPGNVRQLGHAIRRALILAGDDTIELHHLPVEIAAGVGEGKSSGSSSQSLLFAKREFELHYLQRVLRESGGCQVEAAKILGISRKNLWEKLRSDQTLQKLRQARN